MHLLRMIGAAAVLALGVVGVAHAQEQEDEGSISIAAFAGLQNQPGGFDVFRSVSYDAAKMVGGSVVLGLFPALAIRGDLAMAFSSGQEGTPINESVDLNRTYMGVSLELSLPNSSGFSPYVFGGGGLVKLRRTAPSYNFDLTESGALFGGGFAYRFAESPFSAFLQATGWVYPRTSAGGTQFDMGFGAGLRYRIPL